MTEQCSINFFDRCWNKKSKKFKQSITQKIMNKGLEPSQENCRNHWLGLIKPYIWPKSGKIEHLHIKDIRKRRKIYGTARTVENTNRKKNRKPYK